MPASPPLAITGIGCLAAPGGEVAAIRAALAQGSDGLRVHPGCGIPIAEMVPTGRFTGHLPPVPGRTAALAVAAAREALRDARATDFGGMGVVVGTCTAGMPESEADFFQLGRDADPPAYRRQQAHRVTQAVARITRCAGPQSTHSVACASAAAAVVEAMEWLRQGIVEQVVVIGADALCRVTTAGFTSLQLVDPKGCRPLLAERGGMSLGEGAGALVLETIDHARRRGARVRASLLGWGLRADGYHLTSPDPAGTQLDGAIADALADGGVANGQVGFVCAHGTGTRDNDACETTALARRFGAVPTASWKRSFGHTMGACALIEAVGCVLALESQRLWASAGAGEGTPLPGIEVVRTTRAGRLDTVLSTTLAFGGTDAALLFGRAERAR